MIGKLLGFFGGGIGAKVAIAMGAGLLLMTIGMGISVKMLMSAHEKNGQWQQAVNERDRLIGQRDDALDGWKARWSERDAEDARKESLEAEREMAREATAKALSDAKDEIRRLRDADPTVEAYLDQPIPDPLLDSLCRQLSCAAPSPGGTGSPGD